MFPPVFQQLKSSTAVKAIVGTNPPRIWRKRVSQNFPKPITVPYVIWFAVSGVAELNLSDPPPVDRWTVQVDCWHPDDAGCELLASVVRTSLEEICHVTGILIDERDTETNFFRLAMQADLFHGRN